jgi:GNAT superfamily N-acetyltransferase
MVAKCLREGTAAVWLATHRGAACGFAMARADTGDLFALFVLRRAEGLGIGTALLQEAETWLGAHGVSEAWLMTGGEPGLRAPGFYESRCWRLDGTDEDGTLRYVKRLERG